MKQQLIVIAPRVSKTSADWLKKLSRESGHSQAKIIEHLILQTDRLPEKLLLARNNGA